jgi:hypothetical protein
VINVSTFYEKFQDHEDALFTEFAILLEAGNRRRETEPQQVIQTD